ncbi:unnamed protein product [Polarella glacialis]|uniref:Calnexin n=1 Tax=Polarella glacialis TaxID=89957 RepID=A0A813GG97_POLGL|nr:unnamed protein product [Polarella glacialis]
MAGRKCKAVLGVVASLLLLANAEVEEQVGHEAEVDKVKEQVGHEVEESTKPYVAPDAAGLHWVETFDGDVWSRWAGSKQEKYGGKFEVQKHKQEALTGDVGLAVPEDAKHYGAAVKFPRIEGQKDVPFVVQYEAKFQWGVTCAGSYIKLFNSEGKQADAFQDDTPYVIMFGPDKCGGTNKVHFILQHKNPVSGKWEEKHCKDPPSVPNDKLSHLYTLIIRPDNSFEIQVDGVTKTTGNLLTSMQPPINPPKEIDDAEDKKPEDWVEEAKMDDPEASKPEEWDEDAPARIKDPAASMPEGWNEDAVLKIADPSAQKPPDWDDEEDGEWEAPVIMNPACSVGCGKWEAPTTSNPDYKGKWYAPKIDNPAYKGVWKPRQVENPEYFVDETPAILPAIDGVGIDIWTMNSGMIFDNILIATDPSKAQAFAEQSWKLRRELEEFQQPKTSDESSFLTLEYFKGAMGFVLDNAATFGFSLLALLAGYAGYWFMTRGSVAGPAPSAASRKKRDESPARNTKDEAAKEQQGSKAKDKDKGAAKASSSSSSAAKAQKKQGGLSETLASDE